MLRVLSLFDASGVWSAPWAAAGHHVDRFDLTLGSDLSDKALFRALCTARRYDVILAAPPCTVFCRPGARLWPQWDASGRTADHLQLVLVAMNLIAEHGPKVWAIENPPGRLRTLLPGLGKPALSFHPWEYAGWADDPAAEARTKHTYLWGRFAEPERRPVEPEPYPAHLPPGRRDPTSRVSSSWKATRERTPQGFARAFYAAQIGAFDGGRTRSLRDGGAGAGGGAEVGALPAAAGHGRGAVAPALR